MGNRGNLLAGLALMTLTGMELLSGQSLGRFGVTVDRADKPRAFWWNVGISGAAGSYFILRYFHLVP
jgi:hypothetical protein